MITGFSNIHERPNSIVYNMDNMEFMKQMPDGWYDLAVVDPPYGIGNFSQSDAVQDVVWNDYIPTDEYFKELKRVSKKRIIWGANYYNCFEAGNGALIWYKNIGHPSMSHCEIASISGQKKVDYTHINWSGGIRSLQEDFCHPCQKPVSLYDFIYSRYLPNGGRVIDTHLGSGSNRISAHKRGNIIFDAMELDADYFNDSNKRFDDFLMKYEPADTQPITATGQHKLF